MSEKMWVMLTFDLDGETLWRCRDPENANRPVILSQGRYGPETAMPRILELLDGFGVSATFFVPGFTADQYPELVSEMARRGHEVANHGWSHTYPDNMSGPEEEAKEYEDCSAIIERLTGVRPVGYRSPAWEFSKSTVDILEAMPEIVYSSNMMDTERMRYLSFGGRKTKLVEIPIHWVLDDAAYWLYSVRTPGKSMQPLAAVEQYWRDEFDAILEEHEKEVENTGDSDLCFVLTCHPQIVGRPARMKLLQRVVAHMEATGAVEFVTCAEAAHRFNAKQCRCAESTPMRSANSVSRLENNYPLSGIRAMFDIARGREGIINMCNGEPNFETPEHIKESGMRAIAAGMTKYDTEPGLLAMRQAVASKYEREFGFSFTPDNVMLTAGGVEAILLCLMTLINPGDEVIIPDPSYTCYEGQVRTLGGIPVRVPLHEESGFILQSEDLEKAVTPRTKALIINYPNNPLGAVLRKEDGERLANAIGDFYVISDEVYEKIIFDGQEHFSLAQIPKVRDKVLVVNSLSKTYAMTGWRIGYIVGSDTDLMKWMFKMQQAVVSCLPPFIMQAGADAINGSQDCVEEMRQHYERRRNLLVDGLSEISGMRCFKTQGSFCTFINIKDFGVPSRVFAESLLDNAKVLTVAGSAFGSMGEGYLRMCFANSDENIDEAVRRLKAYLK